MDIYDKLRELKIELPGAAAPAGLYQPVVQAGSLVYVSGQVSVENGKPITGRCGADLSVEQAREAARVCAVNTLAQLHSFLGDLNRIQRVVKLLGFVSGTETFDQQPAVVNGASQLMIDVFGDAGRHARSAIGAGALPMGVAVEVESIFQLKD